MIKITKILAKKDSIFIPTEFGTIVEDPLAGKRVRLVNMKANMAGMKFVEIHIFVHVDTFCGHIYMCIFMRMLIRPYMK